MSKISQKTVYRLVMILAVCVFVLANLCAGRLGQFLGLTLDFTGERLYSLSPVTKNALSYLQSETTVYIISSESEYPPILKEILRRYGFLSPVIYTRYIDPHVDTVFLDQYIRQGFPLKESDLLVEGKGPGGNPGIRHIPIADVFRRFNSGRASGLFLEEKLTNAILYVNSSRSFSVSVILGHGENPAALKDALSGSGFIAKDLVLMSGEIPGTDIVIIAGPKRDFLGEEIAVLKNYLDSGGSLMVFMGPGASRLQELENFLSSWDLSLLPGVVLEPIAHAAGNPANLIPMYGMHEISMDFAERQFYLVVPGACAVKPLEEAGDVTITRMLLTTRDSYTKTDSSSRTPGDQSGTFALAALAEKSNGKLMLFGSSGIYADDIIDVPAYANREYLTRAALWLAGGLEHELVSIPPKSIVPPKINSGFGVVLTVLLIFAVILPLAALSAGVITLLKRRRR